MTGGAIAILLGNGFGHHGLRRYDRGIIENSLACADDEIRLPLFHARQIFSPVKFVDDVFEIQILARFRVDELGGVAERAVSRFTRRAAMRPHGIVAGITRGGLRQIEMLSDFAAGGDKLK